MNFYNKSIFYSYLLISFFAANINARSFEVFVKDGNLLTLDNKPVEEYQVINIEGQYPDAVDAPTYGQIRKSIAESFGLDPHWKNFTIKYINSKTGKIYFLKPYIEKLSRKERTTFLNKIAQEGYKGMPVIIIEKRTTKKMQEGKQHLPAPTYTTYQEQIITPKTDTEMGIQIVPEIEPVPAPTDMPLAPRIRTPEKEVLIPDWMFDETLVGESDPALVNQLKEIKKKYE